MLRAGLRSRLSRGLRGGLKGGLRARLLVAFTSVTLFGVIAASWAGAASAGAALVTAAQEQFATTFAAQIGAAAPQLTYPPGQDALDRLRGTVGPDTLVVHRDEQSADGLVIGLVDAEFRAAVRAGDSLLTRRVEAGGRPWLLLGAPVAVTSPTGGRSASGIEVYAVRDLSGVQRELDDLVRSAAWTAALALPVAVLLALVAARGVLRPVRGLRDTARRLAAGELDARATPRGADELTELAETVNRMAASIQRMQSDARRFAADVSHELRTPLSTLTAVVDVLAAAADDLTPEARESARLAIDEVARLTRLVEDLVEVSRFDAGTARPRVEDTDLAEAVRGCLRARGWLDEVELVVPAVVRAPVDRRRLDVIVANLAGNALRHGRPPVRVGVRAEDGHAVIEVTDAGPGLPPEVLPHVFDRFYKRDPARARTPGSGLGLAIALENARLHDGDLTAANDDGGGARFELRLPLRREEHR